MKTKSLFNTFIFIFPSVISNWSGIVSGIPQGSVYGLTPIIIYCAASTISEFVDDTKALRRGGICI